MRRFTFALLAGMALAPAAFAQPLPTATDLLARYLRVDTTNPPGHTEEATAFWERFFAAEGIPTERIALADRKPALLARIGSGPSVVLMHHMDVVPAIPENWEVPPFDGEVRDGVLHGRGVLDTKALGVYQALAMARLMREGTILRHEIIFLAMPDEEVGGVEGAIPFVDQHWQALGAAPWVLLNEGGGGTIGVLAKDVPVMAIGTAEKRPLWLEIIATGKSGHGSVPHENMSVATLSRALDRIANWKAPGRVMPSVATMLEGISHLQPWPVSFVLANAGSAWAAPLIKLAMGYQAITAPMVRSTCSLTGLKAGMKANVIPERAEGTLDCRLLPGVTDEEFLAQLAAVVDDDRVTFATIMSGRLSAPSPWDDPAVAIIRAEVEKHLPEAVTVPLFSAGFTDSMHFRAKGLHSYGFFPALLTLEEGRSIHNRNEQIRVDALEAGDPIYTSVVRALGESDHE